MKKLRLFTPGPCAVPEEVLIEMARPFHHHRTDWFKGLMKEAVAKLQQVLQTRNEVIVITGSGTAAAEAAIVGCHPAGVWYASPRWTTRSTCRTCPSSGTGAATSALGCCDWRRNTPPRPRRRVALPGDV